MRLHVLLATTVFAVRALADLTCRDYVPHNWTSPLARLYLIDNDADNPETHDPPTLPANLTLVSNTLTLAPKKSSGNVFRLRVCTSKSLGLNSTESFYCPPPDRRRKRQDNECYADCNRNFINNLQIIDPATGHCFTWQQTQVKLANYNFVPCNPNPTNQSQIIQAYRSYTYYVDSDYQPAGVCDWGEDITVYQSEQLPYSDKYGWFQAWELAKNNKTVVSLRGIYPNEWNVYAKHHDPLTTYKKK